VQGYGEKAGLRCIYEFSVKSTGRENISLDNSYTLDELDAAYDIGEIEKLLCRWSGPLMNCPKDLELYHIHRQRLDKR
jgi:hypothetical protein